MALQKKSAAGKKQPAKPSGIDHQSYRNEIQRLARIRGQIDGIERMIVEGRYCPDIMNQIKSATSALRAVEKQVLQRHLHHCVTEAIQSGSAKEADGKIRELMDLFNRS